MSFLEQLHQPITYAVPFFAIFLLIEILAFRFLEHDEDLKGYDPVDTRTSLLMGVGSVVINGVTKIGALVGYSALYVLSPLKLDPQSWVTWLIVLLGVDFLWYWYHRMSHRVRIMWAAHQVHHNSQHFNFSTALRQKWNPWFELLFWIPLPLLGVPPWMIFISFSINLIYQFFAHTERIGRLPSWFEFLFNTPSHHRVHHASDKDYLDKNFAGILIIWDRMFGTFKQETFRPKYGLTKNIDSTNLLTLQYQEFGAVWRDVRGARRMRDRVGYLFGPPGWAPADGTA